MELHFRIRLGPKPNDWCPQREGNDTQRLVKMEAEMWRRVSRRRESRQDRVLG